MKLIGIDVGGTFTDGIFLDRDTGKTIVTKTHSTPENQRIGVMNAIKESGNDLRDVELLLHGTTVATNAVIEKKGAKVGLITTTGFRDVLKIRRTTRGKLYDLQWDQPQELVERKYRLEVDERIDGFGNEVRPLPKDELLSLAKFFVDEGIEAIAICFINSYANPSHEIQATEIIRAEYPQLYITYSSAHLQEWREFERMSTVSAAAYVGPLLRNYMSSLSDEVKSKGYSKDILCMLSNGGVAPVFPVERIAPRTLLSGPAAAAIAMKGISESIGEKSVISIDIGGTSTDIAMVHNGELMTKDEQEIEFGTVVHLPIIDVVTIGAGGGTLAWIDRGGMLNMGPKSAGASPGPVCYDHGGTEPALTDANVLLGRLNQQYLLGGSFKIDAALSRSAIEEKVAKPFGMDVYEAAQGMIDIVDQNISNAIRRLSMNRGYDIREFALFACGGAGPLQAVDVAKSLGMCKVIVPRYPGITAAIGLLMSDVRYDYVESMIVPMCQLAPRELSERYSSLIEKTKADLARAGFDEAHKKILMYADIRYMAQTHELTVALDPADLTDKSWRSVAEKFHALHHAAYGYASPLEHELELVSVRCSGFGLLDTHDAVSFDAAPKKPAEPFAYRQVFLKGKGMRSVPVYNREDIGRDFRGVGPAIIEQMDTTVFIDDGDSFAAAPGGNLVISWDK